MIDGVSFSYAFAYAGRCVWEGGGGGAGAAPGRGGGGGWGGGGGGEVRESRMWVIVLDNNKGRFLLIHLRICWAIFDVCG